ncbi:MAG: 2Fe-2S iron-sulfur cluster-binding protein, partial [Leptolyngbyaceae cyanobacterium bins.302]|nr:2Fe-2S iron-sulfur cluster-binding protein [Leptolyngbyaceae cyanobacterium bins.302]
AIAEQIGVVIQNACRAGVCGMCKVLVKEGEVEHAQPPVALHPDDESAGYVLACIACPVSRVVVEA